MLHKRDRYFRINCIAILLCLLFGFVYQAGESAGSGFYTFNTTGDHFGSTGVITDFCRIGSESVIARTTERTGEITDSAFRIVQNANLRDSIEVSVPLLVLFAIIWALLFIFEFHIVIPSITASLKTIILFILSKDGQKSALS